MHYIDSAAISAMGGSIMNEPQEEQTSFLEEETLSPEAYFEQDDTPHNVPKIRKTNRFRSRYGKTPTNKYLSLH